MEEDHITENAHAWLYAQDGERVNKEIRVTPHDGYGTCPYAPSVEYAVRLANAEIAPGAPDPEQGHSYRSVAWLAFPRKDITDGILSLTGMSLYISSPAIDINAVEIPMPLYAFAHDPQTVVIRYDPGKVAELDPEQLADVLYLTMEMHVDPDDFDDHHDLERERQDVHDRAATIAQSIINADTGRGFLQLLAQHVEDFHTTMPWPEERVTAQAKDGKVTIIVNP